MARSQLGGGEGDDGEGVGEDVEQFSGGLLDVGGELELIGASADEAEEQGGADDSGGGPAAENHDGQGEETAAFGHVFDELLAADGGEICAGQTGAGGAEKHRIEPSPTDGNSGRVGGLGGFADGAERDG